MIAFHVDTPSKQKLLLRTTAAKPNIHAIRVEIPDIPQEKQDLLGG
jgi:hypothetical protein